MKSCHCKQVLVRFVKARKAGPRNVCQSCKNKTRIVCFISLKGGCHQLKKKCHTYVILKINEKKKFDEKKVQENGFEIVRGLKFYSILVSPTTKLYSNSKYQDLKTRWTAVCCGRKPVLTSDA